MRPLVQDGPSRAGRDPRAAARVMHVAQGEFVVANGPDDMLTTILGSCVSACIWDPEAAIGGMNHIVLPDAPDTDIMRASAGTNAMELLINGIIRQGGDRRRFKAKLFGGAKMIAGLSDVGLRNASFTERFLSDENIEIVSKSLGGSAGRRVQFWPASGRARQMTLNDTEVPFDEVQPVAPPAEGGSDLELF